MGDGDATSLGDSSESGSKGSVVQFVLVGLLILAAIKSYIGRETAEPPKMLGRLQQADSKLAFKTGLVLIGLFPSDVLVLLTVGMNLEQSDAAERGLSSRAPCRAPATRQAALAMLSGGSGRLRR